MTAKMKTSQSQVPTVVFET